MEKRTKTAFFHPIKERFATFLLVDLPLVDPFLLLNFLYLKPLKSQKKFENLCLILYTVKL